MLEVSEAIRNMVRRIAKSQKIKVKEVTEILMRSGLSNIKTLFRRKQK